MANIYSKRLLLSTSASSPTVSASPPAGFLWVAHTLTAAGNGAEAEVVMFIAGIPVWGASITPPGGSFYSGVTWTGRAVINAGETLEMFCSAGLTGQISGYELSATG